MARTTITVDAYQPGDLVWCIDRHTEKITDGAIKEVVITQQGTTTSVKYKVQFMSFTIREVNDADTYDSVDAALAELKILLTD